MSRYKEQVGKHIYQYQFLNELNSKLLDYNQKLNTGNPFLCVFSQMLTKLTAIDHGLLENDFH